MRAMSARAGRPGLTVGVDELRGGAVSRVRRVDVSLGCCWRMTSCRTQCQNSVSATLNQRSTCASKGQLALCK